MSEEKKIIRKESDLVETLSFLKKHVEGELELSLEEGQWYARDYKESLGGSFSVKHKYYSQYPVISEETKIDVRKCCQICDIYCVG